MLKKKGMTLVELIAAVAIINVILFIAYPAYEGYIKSSHEDNVKLQMFDIASDLERIKMKYYSYEAALDDDNNLITNQDLLIYPIDNSQDKRYDIEIKSLSPSTFIIQATATTLQGTINDTLKLEYNGESLKGYKDVNGNNSWRETWY